MMMTPRCHGDTGDDISEKSLEAELLALHGGSPSGAKKKKGSKVAMADIDSMVAGLAGIGEEVRVGGVEGEGGEEWRGRVVREGGGEGVKGTYMVRVHRAISAEKRTERIDSLEIKEKGGK